MEFHTFKKVSAAEYLVATTKWGAEYKAMIDGVGHDEVGVITLDPDKPIDAQSSRVRMRLRAMAEAMGKLVDIKRAKVHGQVVFTVVDYDQIATAEGPF